MAKSKTTPERKCEFCDKRGLPLLIVRCAIATQDGGAPNVTGPAIALKGKAAHYTLRLARTGYLYLYDEARDRWECWYITPDGFYFKIHETPGKPIALPTKPFNCPDVGHKEVASCITVRDPVHATNVWLGFSDDRWTAEVKKKHQEASYRKRHMTKIDVKKVLADGLPSHCKPIAKVGEVVAEYAMTEANGKKAFVWGPFQYNARADQAAKLVKKCDQLRPNKGLVVAIDDPTGIAQELALLMRHNAMEFGNRREFKRGVEVNGVIVQMEHAIKDMARRNALTEADIAASQLANPPMDETGGGGLGITLARLFNKKLDDIYTQLEDETRNLSAAQLKKAADEEWARYTGKFHDKDQRQPWMDDFNTKLTTFDADYIAPLATAHAAWMKSEPMDNYFQCNFDTFDIVSGNRYVALLGDCIATTVDKKACFDIYDEWMCASPTDNTNLLLRALTYNQDDLAKQIASAASSGVDWAGLPWDKLSDAHGKATDRLLEGSPDTLGRLIGMIAGPIAKTLRTAAESRKVYAGLVAVGLAAKKPIVAVEVTGGRKVFRATLIRQMVKLGGTPQSENAMRKAVSDELRLLKAQGVKLEGTEKKRWLLMVDPEQMKDMPKSGLSAKEQAQWAAKNIYTVAQVDELNLSNYRARVQSAAGAVRGGVPFAFGVLGIVANWVALDSLQVSDAKAMEHDKAELSYRVQFQRAQLIGAISSVLEVGLAKLPAFGSEMGNAVSRVLAGVAGRVATVFGVGGAMLMAVVDLIRGGIELWHGNVSAGIAYGVSAALGGLATYFLWVGATGWGLVFVALMFLWSFVMLRMTDNKLQEWLKRCLWGTLTKEQYPDLETEMRQLQAAMAG